jgi:hypothetical protein
VLALQEQFSNRLRPGPASSATAISTTCTRYCVTTPQATQATIFTKDTIVTHNTQVTSIPGPSTNPRTRCSPR